MSNEAFPPVLDENRVDLLQGAVALAVASRDQQLRPSVCEAAGCRVSADRKQVTVLLPRASVGDLLDHLGCSGAIALVAAHPVSHESLQLKGGDAREIAVTPEDRALVAAHVSDFADLLVEIGEPRSFVDQLRLLGEADLVAVAFTPIAVYLQTPGPRAGEALGASS